MRSHAAIRGPNLLTDHWARRKEEYDREAEVIRKAILRADELETANLPVDTAAR
jgi:hypothetical protein